MSDRASVHMGNFGERNQALHNQLTYVCIVVDNDGTNLPFMVQRALKEGINDWCKEGRMCAIMYDTIMGDMSPKDKGIGLHYSDPFLEELDEIRIIYINYDNFSVIIGDHIWSFNAFAKLDLASEITKWW